MKAPDIDVVTHPRIRTASGLFGTTAAGMSRPSVAARIFHCRDCGTRTAPRAGLERCPACWFEHLDEISDPGGGRIQAHTAIRASGSQGDSLTRMGWIDMDSGVRLFGFIDDATSATPRCGARVELVECTSRGESQILTFRPVPTTASEDR